MNLFLKPLVCHATIPANSRQIPEMSKKSRQTKHLGHKWFCKWFHRKKSPRTFFSNHLCATQQFPPHARKFPTNSRKIPAMSKKSRQPSILAQVVSYKRNLKLQPPNIPFAGKNIEKQCNSYVEAWTSPLTKNPLSTTPFSKISSASCKTTNSMLFTKSTSRVGRTFKPWSFT